MRQDSLTILCTEPQLSILLENLLAVRVITWSEGLTSEGIFQCACLMIGEMAVGDLKQNEHAYEALKSRVVGGAPVLFFGGWRSFGAGGWESTDFTRRLNFTVHPDDARQSFLSLERTHLAKEMNLPQPEAHSYSGGYHAVTGVSPNRILIWGRRLRDGARVPLLILGRGRCLSFTGYLVPTGGKRLFFSPSFIALMQWVIEALTGKPVAEKSNESDIARAVKSYWRGNRPTSSLEHIGLSETSFPHGRRGHYQFLRELSDVCGEWKLAAMFSRELGVPDSAPRAHTLEEPASWKYEAIAAQQERDWRRAAESYEAASERWKYIERWSDSKNRAHSFAKFYSDLAAEATFVWLAETNQWPEALLTLTRANLGLEPKALTEGHALAQETARDVKVSLALVRELERWRSKRPWDPIQAVRLLRSLYTARREAQTALASSLLRLRSLYPQLRQTPGQEDVYRHLPRIHREVLSQGIEGKVGMAPEAASLLMPTYALFILLNRLIAVAVPLKYRAVLILSWWFTSFVVGMIGFWWWPAGIIGLALTIVAWQYQRWSHR